MNTEKLKLVKLKHSVFKHNVKNQLLKTIKETIMDIPNYDQLRNDPELILFICNLIENGYEPSKTKLKLDKKSLACDVMTAVFPDINLQPNEMNNIQSLIEFLHSNNKINKIQFSTFIASTFYDWTKKKFL